MQTIPTDEGSPTVLSASLEMDARRLMSLLLTMERRSAVPDPLESACVALELSPAQVHSLLSLQADGALTMGELARRIGVTEKTLTGIVDRMEQAGLVHRERDSHDRRVVRVTTTDVGRQQASEARRLIQARIAKLLGLLDVNDRADLFRILDKLTRGPDGAAREHA